MYLKISAGLIQINFIFGVCLWSAWAFKVFAVFTCNSVSYVQTKLTSAQIKFIAWFIKVEIWYTTPSRADMN